MSMYRIWGLFLRYMLLLKHSLSRQVVVLYFPLLDIIVFGLASLWADALSTTASTLSLLYISLRVLWNVANAVQLEITGNLIQEIREHNVANLFAAPITLTEWLSATMMLGLTRGIFSFFYGAFVAWLIFSINIFSCGWAVITASCLLAWTGLTVAFIISGLLLRYGTVMDVVRWALIRTLILFSAAFYPLEILPAWMQKVALFLPTTYAFKMLHHVTGLSHSFSDVKLGIILNGVYFCAACMFLYYQFAQSKMRGLAQAECK